MSRAQSECPCKIPTGSKEHLRRNPTTDKTIFMCTKHASQHDNGVVFELYRPEPKTNR